MFEFCMKRDILGFQGGEYKDDNRLEYSAV
jgi:hypothetical protein